MFVRGTENVNVFVVAEVEKPLSRKHLSPDGATPKSVRLELCQGPCESDQKRQDRRLRDPRTCEIQA